MLFPAAVLDDVWSSQALRRRRYEVTHDLPSLQNSAHSMFQIFQLTYVLGPFCRDPAVRLGSFGFKKVKKNLKAVRVVSVPLRFGSSRFKKRFGSMSAIRVLPESNSNLAISFQSILCWNYF